MIIVLTMALNTVTSMLAGDEDDDSKQRAAKSATSKPTKKGANQMQKTQFKGLALVGASGSGKTTLFYQLSTG